jgi:predicted transcriptional regulator
MKRIAILLLSTLLIVACQLTPKQLGEPFEENNIITIDDLLSQLETQNTLEKIQIEGTIYKTCLSEGCWFAIQDKNNNEIILNIKDKKFRMPNTSSDKKVIVLADATYIQADTINGIGKKYKIDVRGVKFK